MREFQNKLRDQYRDNTNVLQERVSEDVYKSRHGHDWIAASTEITELLNNKCREPQRLLFKVGLTYTCTFNDNRKSNSQKVLLFDLPSEQTLNTFGPIKVLLAPPGCKNVCFDARLSKQYYIDQGYVETSIQCSPRKIYMLKNNIQGLRKQYGLQHYISGTIHSIMGDTLPSLATTFSNEDRNFSMWDKGQLLVILSRTKESKQTIFVGDKNSTLDALCNILTQRTQWTDYMEQILKIITMN